MAKLVQWVKKAVQNLVDPDKEQRIGKLASHLQYYLNTQREHFQLAPVVRNLDCTQADVELAKERVYRSYLERAWADESLTTEEQRTANWIAVALQLPPVKSQQIRIEYARAYFAAALVQAMQDGNLDPREEARLNQIAASVGSNLQAFVREFFQYEGESFLRGLFAAFVADGALTQAEWQHLFLMTQKLGLDRSRLLAAIQNQVCRFIESVLANAKADNQISSSEEATLRWLLDNLCVDQSFRQYVEKEVETVRTLSAINEGRLPSIAAPLGVAVRAGEIVHLCAAAVWHDLRILKSGPRQDTHQGLLVVTDNRLVFSSPTKSQSFGYRKITFHRGGNNWIEIQTEGRATTQFVLQYGSVFAYPVVATAIDLANQVRTARNDGLQSRHIPRDVRQRVWQKYGGRCADCNAADYLEFDHIIPVAKGGNNTDNNIQLLCRRCNSKKSDHI